MPRILRWLLDFLEKIIGALIYIDLRSYTTSMLPNDVYEGVVELVRPDFSHCLLRLYVPNIG